MSIYAKLNAAREEFHTLQLKKTGKNAFAGYQYFELGDFLLPAMLMPNAGQSEAKANWYAVNAQDCAGLTKCALKAARSANHIL
jgi:hypothetical protein